MGDEDSGFPVSRWMDRLGKEMELQVALDQTRDGPKATRALRYMEEGPIHPPFCRGVDGLEEVRSKLDLAKPVDEGVATSPARYFERLGPVASGHAQSQVQSH